MKNGGRRKNRENIGSSKAENSHIGLDISGTNAVDLNIILAPLIGQGFGELSEGTFRRSIGRNGQSPLESQERAEVDDFSATP
jgi:hypothetical protein